MKETMEQPKMNGQKKEQKDTTPYELRLQIQRKVMELFGTPHNDVEKEVGWVEKNADKFRELWKNNEQMFMDIAKDKESLEDLPQLIKMVMDREN